MDGILASVPKLVVNLMFLLCSFSDGVVDGNCQELGMLWMGGVGGRELRIRFFRALQASWIIYFRLNDGAVAVSVGCLLMVTGCLLR